MSERHAPLRPRRAEHRRRTALAIALAVLVAAGLIAQHQATAGSVVPKNAVRVDVAATPTGPPVPRSFVGLSIEYTSVPPYFGTGPRALNQTFIRLVRDLDPAGSPMIRIGGDTTDWTWWPTPGIARPLGIRYTLSPHWLAVTRAMASALGARLILGINLEADSKAIAGAESRALLSGLGRSLIAGFELGNEPEVYGSLGWYTTRAGVSVRGRPQGYGFYSYLRDFRAISAALPRAVPLIGPASGDATWAGLVGRYLSANPRVRAVTFHRYPLRRCQTSPRSPTYATVPNLLSPTASSEPALSLQRAVASAHARGLPLRVDELNSVSCGGKRGVSNTFASALWVLDTLFYMARGGVDGVNIHTSKSSRYAPFAFTHAHGRWVAHVRPMYYGLLMFARAAPAGARLLSTSAGPSTTLHVWATRDLQRTVHVVVINDSPSRAATMAIRVPHAGESATVERLSAPRATSTGGVTIAGQTFGPATTNARLTGGQRPTSFEAIQNRFVFSVPPASAAVLSVNVS